MGEKCSKKMHAGFWFENLKERDHLEMLYLEGRLTLILILKNYINLAQVKDKLLAIVKAVMNP
jgi:hypothetical protein